MQKLVVALVKDDEGSYLIGKRPKTEPSPSLWEFPGDVLEETDPIPATLQRVMREKIGVEVKVLSELPHFTHTRSDGTTLAVIPFECKTLGMPKRKYHDAIRWAPIDEMTTLPFFEGSEEIISYLEKTSI